MKTAKTVKKSVSKKAIKPVVKGVSKTIEKKAAKPVAKTAAKPTIKPVSKAETKTAVKAAPKVEVKPAIKPVLNGNGIVTKPVAKKTIVKTAVKAAPTYTRPTGKKNPNRKKYTLEYVIRSSPVILYEFLTTPSLMAEWFADEVDSFKNEYSFTWEGQTQKARVLEEVENDFICFQWIDGDPDEYLEFKISSTEITGDTVLTITDFCDNLDEKDSKLLWDSQVKLLEQHLGAI